MKCEACEGLLAAATGTLWDGVKLVDLTEGRLSGQSWAWQSHCAKVKHGENGLGSMDTHTFCWPTDGGLVQKDTPGLAAELMSVIELVVDRPEPGHQPAWNHVRISKVAVARETYK